MWLDPKKYKDYDKLEAISQLAKSIVINSQGVPDDIDNMPDNLKGFIAKDNSHPEKVNWSAITVYQRLDTFEFVADKIDPRYVSLRNEIEKIPSITQAVINYIGAESITPWHQDSKVYESTLDTQNCSGVMANNVVAPTYQIMIGLWIPFFENDEIALTFRNGDTKIWKTDDIVAFDGSFEHMGWNRTKQVRVSLFIDVLQESFDV
jgi:hypothetical protein